MSHSTNILDLNDDCFYVIFKLLPITTDWCSLRDTCTRFRSISDYLFEKQSKSFQLKPNYGSVYINLEETKRFIRSFGQYITKLSIDRNSFHYEDDPSQLVAFLGRYCHSLKSLELILIDLVPATICQCKELFSNLHRFVIKYWKNRTTFGLCMASCTSLIELEIIGLCEMEESSLARNYALLESVTMRSCCNSSVRFMKHFIARNPQLKRLRVLNCTFVKCNDIVGSSDLDMVRSSRVNNNLLIELRVIDVKNCDAILENTFPKLQLFSYQGVCLHMNDCLSAFISRHPTLKTLDVESRIYQRFNNVFMRAIGNSCKELIKLTLNLYPEIQNVDHFRQLPQMELVEIIGQLRNLEELSIGQAVWNKFELKKTTFSEISKIVEGRPNVLTLKCDFSFNLDTSKENPKLKLVRLVE